MVIRRQRVSAIADYPNGTPGLPQHKIEIDSQHKIEINPIWSTHSQRLSKWDTWPGLPATTRSRKIFQTKIEINLILRWKYILSQIIHMEQLTFPDTNKCIAIRTQKIFQINKLSQHYDKKILTGNDFPNRSFCRVSLAGCILALQGSAAKSNWYLVVHSNAFCNMVKDLSKLTNIFVQIFNVFVQIDECISALHGATAKSNQYLVAH